VAYKVLQCKEGMLLRLGREPSLEELAKELDIPEGDVAQALDAVCAPVSLHDPVYTDGGDALYMMDQISDKTQREDKWIEDLALQEAMRRLPDRERSIIKKRFFDGKTQMEVAQEIHISQAQVSRLEKNALKSMRKYLS
jgi:RNA polymerase sporulation-specific sigma factor